MEVFVLPKMPSQRYLSGLQTNHSQKLQADVSGESANDAKIAELAVGRGGRRDSTPEYSFSLLSCSLQDMLQKQEGIQRPGRGQGLPPKITQEDKRCLQCRYYTIAAGEWYGFTFRLRVCCLRPYMGDS